METTLLVLPLFALMLGGYLARKTSFLSPAFARDANRLIYYIALPVTLFTKMQDLTPSDFAQPGIVIGYTLSVLATTLFALLVSLRFAPAVRGAFVQVAFRGNLAYVGLPIGLTAFGPEAAGPLAVGLAVGLIIHTWLSIVVLRFFAPDIQTVSMRRRLLESVYNPLIIAVLLGLLASFSQIALPAFLLTTFGWIADMSLPLVLIVLGSALSFTRLRTGLSIYLLATLAKLVFMPTVAFLIATYVLDLSVPIRNVLVLLAATPTAVISQTLATQFDADTDVTAGGISLTTLLSMVSIPLWLAVLSM